MGIAGVSAKLNWNGLQIRERALLKRKPFDETKNSLLGRD